LEDAVLDVRRLRLLRELKHRGTLAAVATALAYSPSAVSQQLTQLEAEAGVPLLEPVGRRVRLTAQAEILVAHTEFLLERLERAEADLAASATAVAGTLRVASFQTAALALIPPALSHADDHHPALRVEVTVIEPESALPALVSRDFDLVLGEEYPGHPLPRRHELERESLFNDSLILAAPHSWQTPAISGLSDLADRPWVMEPAGTAARDWSTAMCRAAGFEPDVRFTSTDILLHRRLVETGHAAALLPNLAGPHGNRTVKVMGLPDAPARQIFTAVRRGANAHPAIVALRQSLHHAASVRLDQTVATPPAH
jgi:DNA-binding transcriptional LysR family regulator